VPAHSVLWLFIAEDLQALVDPIYNDAVGREIDKLAAAIPHRDLAIQFDVASAVFARLQRGDTGVYGDSKAAMQDKFAAILATLANRVPADIELLFHLCYGDSNHRHVVEPVDMGDMVEMAMRLNTLVKRRINLIHMPVPRDRSDDAYFAPLARLKLQPETQFALGLVHFTDGVDGTARRMATARKYVRDFAVGTECGFGRRDPATIPELLRIHAAASALD
jgi:methionine synthase II (cobalamin-independent)